MNINVERAENIELGEYMKTVSLIRNNDSSVSDETFMNITKITPTILRITRQVISEHPDWDDEEVADEVIFMEEQEQQ